MPDKFKQLENILNNCLLNVMVSVAGFRVKSFKAEKYKLMLQSYLGSDNEHHVLSSGIFHVKHSFKIQKPADERDLRDFLKSELKDILTGDVITIPTISNCGPHTLSMVVSNLLRLSILYGVAKATRLFFASLEKQELYFYRYWLLSGIKVNHKIEIIEGYSLLPITAVLRWPEIVRFNIPRQAAAMLRAKLILPFKELKSRRYLETKSFVFDFWGGLNKEGDIFLPTPEREKSLSLARLLRCLSLISNQAILPLIQSTHTGFRQFFLQPMFIDPRVKTNLFIAGGKWRAGSSTKEGIAPLLTYYSKLESEKLEDWLNIPIKFWVKSSATCDKEEAILFVAIALECFYLYEPMKNKIARDLPKKKTISIRAKQHLSMPEKVISQIKELYDLRSNIVHTGRISEKDINGIEGKIKTFQDICRLSILQGINLGSPPVWSNKKAE